ncbi:MAG TPA: molybdopterin molybdenumtransferase MoeA, partial [Bacteroidetes bacterium]|nr:molybdopterin molybdenumtransferase MoeA [Bacteroidota bacterium]
MISIEEAVAVLKQNLPPRKTETVAVESALQAVLAGDIVAPEPSPRFTNSAIDGFAVRWSDVGPAARGEAVNLTVVGESRAGHPYTGA